MVTDTLLLPLIDTYEDITSLMSGKVFQGGVVITQASHAPVDGQAHPIGA